MVNKGELAKKTNKSKENTRIKQGITCRIKRHIIFLGDKDSMMILR